MAKLVYHIATTLDNFIADLDGNADSSIFLYEGEHVTDFITDVQQYNAVLMGGKHTSTDFNSVLNPVNLVILRS